MITLQKLRVYRDRAEVLLQVKLTDEVEVSPSTRVYAVPLGELTNTERSSLHILSPHCRLLHVVWHKDEESDTLEESEYPQPIVSLTKTDQASGFRQPWGDLVEEIRAQRDSLSQRSRLQSLTEIQRTLHLEKTLGELEQRWSAEIDSDLLSSKDAEADGEPKSPLENVGLIDQMTSQVTSNVMLYLYM